MAEQSFAKTVEGSIFKGMEVLLSPLHAIGRALLSPKARLQEDIARGLIDLNESVDSGTAEALQNIKINPSTLNLPLNQQAIAAPAEAVSTAVNAPSEGQIRQRLSRQALANASPLVQVSQPGLALDKLFKSRQAPKDLASAIRALSGLSGQGQSSPFGGEGDLQLGQQFGGEPVVMDAADVPFDAEIFGLPAVTGNRPTEGLVATRMPDEDNRLATPRGQQLPSAIQFLSSLAGNPEQLATFMSTDFGKEFGKKAVGSLFPAKGKSKINAIDPKMFTPESLQAFVDAGENNYSLLQPSEFAKKGGGKGGAGGFVSAGTVITKDDKKGVSFQGLVLDKGTGKYSVQSIPITGNLVTRQGGATPTELMNLDVQEEVEKVEKTIPGKVKTAEQTTAAELKAQAKGKPEVIAAEGGAKRIQASIDAGIDSSAGIPGIKRNLELLNIIETGGFEKAKLFFTKMFGVTPADETELDSMLGKEVLKQIKPLFGSAPSERESGYLIDLSENFGKSTEGNRRLLRRGLALLEEKARQAINDAEFVGDTRAAERIRRNMEFRLEVEEKQKEKVGSIPPPPEHPNAIYTGDRDENGLPIFMLPNGRRFLVKP